LRNGKRDSRHYKLPTEGLVRVNRREFLVMSGAVAFGAFGTVNAEATKQPLQKEVMEGGVSKRVDNVVLIISDTLRRDFLSCYGNDWIYTPHLKRFASMSLIFDQAWICSFPTVPCRHDILTGRYTFTYKPWAPLDPETVTLQETLNKANIMTALFADTPHPFAPGYNYQRGFRVWELIRGQEHDGWKSDTKEVKLPCAPEKLRNPWTTVVQYLRNVSYRQSEEDYFPALTMREAAKWLEKNYDRRFFLYIDTFDPHEPWDPPRYYVDMYDPGYDGEEVIYPRYDLCDYLTERELKHCRALYAGEVTLVDHWFGYLLDRIESLGLLKNTAIIFTTDHGFYLGEHGYIGKSLITEKYQQSIPLYPEVAHIPLLIYIPGVEGGKRISALVSLVDLMPTILDLLGVPIPETVQSYSLLPLIEGKKEKVRDFAVASPTISHKGIKVPHPTNRSSITDGEWLLIYGSQVDKVKDPQTTAMVDSIMRTVKTLEKGPIRPKLFHLPTDRECKHDVIEKHRDVAEALHKRYVELLEACNVPEEHLQFFRQL
jgi:arylsulfatase A-like enzyme